MKFQNPCILHSTVSNLTLKWNYEVNFQNSVTLSTFEVKFSKVNEVIYSLISISTPNMKALTQILFEIPCTQDF